jgi:hypothetical protein
MYNVIALSRESTNKDTSVLPLLVIASDTILIPRAVASDLARIACASPGIQYQNIHHGKEIKIL